MRKKIKWFVLFFSCCSFAKGQVDFQNAGTLYISSATDTLHINGNFTNTSAAAFTNNGRLHVKQNFTNNQASMATGTGTLYLNGTATQSIATTAGSAFYNLTVNKASGLVTLATNATANNTLTLTSGKISLGNNNLTLGASGSVTAASASGYIIAEGTGSLIQQVNNNTTKSFPVGTSSYFLPASIGLSLASVTDNFSVRVLDKVYAYGNNGGNITTSTVNATWVVSETTPGGSNATVGLQWPAALELSGFNRNFCRLADYNSGSWNYGYSDTAASGSNPYTVARAGFNSVSFFAISSFDALPVTWLTLTGKNENHNNYIQWSTASEINNSYFVIEVSANGNNFSEIGRINASTTPGYIHEYNFVHYNVNTIVNFYRIKQVDLDRKFSYSKIIKLSSAAYSSNNISILMNPVKNNPVMAIQLTQGTVGTIIITDAAGRIVYKEKENLQAGNNIIEVNSFNQPTGVYRVTFTDENGLKLVTGFLKQ
jgi:hypothetical protein